MAHKALKTLRNVHKYMLSLCGIGITLSVYAYYVETMKESNKSYQAMCDISPSVSCSRVFTSKYGRGFGIIGRFLGEGHILNQPNAVFGLFFYCLVALLGEIKSLSVAKYQRLLVTVSNAMSVYLGYLLYFVLHDFCVICVTTYIVNILLTVCSFYKVSAIHIALSDDLKKSC